MASDARGEAPRRARTSSAARTTSTASFELSGTIRVRRGRHRQRAASRRTSARSARESSGTGTESVTTTVDLLCGGDGGAALVDAARRWGEGNGTGTGTGTPGRAMRGANHTRRARGVDGGAGEHAAQRGRDGGVRATLPPLRYPPWQLHKAEMYHRRSLRGFHEKEPGGRFCGGTRGCRSGSGGERGDARAVDELSCRRPDGPMRESPSLSAR